MRTALLKLRCGNYVVGTALWELRCWNCVVGTGLLELRCENCVVGTTLLELRCENCVVRTTLLELRCAVTVEDIRRRHSLKTFVAPQHSPNGHSCIYLHERGYSSVG